MTRIAVFAASALGFAVCLSGALAAQRLPAGIPASAMLLLRYDGNHDGIVTRTDVKLLDESQRREEIARMLSGATITDEARAQAERLLEAA